jgi:hypothetical protein
MEGVQIGAEDLERVIGRFSAPEVGGRRLPSDFGCRRGMSAPNANVAVNHVQQSVSDRHDDFKEIVETLTVVSSILEQYRSSSVSPVVLSKVSGLCRYVQFNISCVRFNHRLA